MHAARIFISYKRINPDAAVAQALHRAFSDGGHDVFLDVTLPVGVHWAEQIEAELHRTDILVPLLSEQAARSDMVIAELETAIRLKKRILPVRLAYREPFKYPLSAWLNPINWAFWDGPDTTPRLADELKRGISGEELPIREESARRRLLEALPPDALTLESGAMDVASPLYVRRRADDVALAAIAKKGQTISVKGARQVGKSSLLMRIIDAAIGAGKQVVFLDFQALDTETLASADVFFRRFCAEVAKGLELKAPLDPHWDPSLGNLQRCSGFMQDGVLKHVNTPVVLALDEVDRLFDSPFRSDFFGMLRAWHGKRALPTTQAWKRLDLVLVTSTEPRLLIENLNQSPFNVGERIELSELSPEEVSRLNHLHGEVLGPEDERRLLALVGGHPYLVRRALYLLASRQTSPEDLLSQANLEDGSFGDHLRHLLFLITGRATLADGLREVLGQGTCRNPMLLDRLRSAGLIRVEGDRAVPRCHLYERYFRKHLLG